jgi:hypothetical protein
VQPVSVSIIVTTTGTGIVTAMLSTVRSDSRRCNERCTIATVTVRMNQTYVPSIEYSSSLHLQLPLLSIYNYLSSPSTSKRFSSVLWPKCRRCQYALEDTDYCPRIVNTRDLGLKIPLRRELDRLLSSFLPLLLAHFPCPLPSTAPVPPPEGPRHPFPCFLPHSPTCVRSQISTVT